MTQQDAPVTSSPVTPRIEQFNEGVASLDVPTPSPRAETWLLYGGIGFVVVGVILIMGGLQFFPALALGPIVEHFAMLAGQTF